MKNTITLLQGDCLELMKGIDAGSIDCIICDLPYGMTANAWDSPIPEAELWTQYRRIIKPNGAIILFGSGRFTASLIVSAKELYRYTLIWQKTQPVGFLNANRMPLRAHEDIIVCYKKQPTYNPQKTHGHPRKVATAGHKRNCSKSTNYNDYNLTSYDSTDRFPTSVLTFAKDKQKSALHPCQKPVALLEWLVLTYTNRGDTVLDNCFGSGSTGEACVNTGRNFIGIEINKSSFVAGKERIEKAEARLNQQERNNETGGAACRSE